MDNRRPFPLSLLLCGTGYTIYFSSVIGFIILTIPLSLILFPFGKPRAFFRNLMERSLQSLVTILLPLLNVAKIEEIKDLKRINSFDGGVVIGNHRGWLDGPLLLGHIKGVLPLMKSSYATNPLYRMFTSWFNFINLDTSTQEGLISAHKECSDQIKKGGKLLIFPEGTRSQTNRLLPFKKLAFLLSVETKTPIYPVIIHSNIPFMTKNLLSFFPPKQIKYRLIGLDPITPEKNEKAEQLMARCEKVMIKAWRDLDTKFGET